MTGVYVIHYLHENKYYTSATKAKTRKEALHAFNTELNTLGSFTLLFIRKHKEV